MPRLLERLLHWIYLLITAQGMEEEDDSDLEATPVILEAGSSAVRLGTPSEADLHLGSFSAQPSSPMSRDAGTSGSQREC